MPAKTSGGLFKRSYQLTAETLAAVREVAADKGASESAAVRELVSLGYRVYQRRKPATAPVEELAVEVVANEGDAA